MGVNLSMAVALLKYRKNLIFFTTLFFGLARKSLRLFLPGVLLKINPLSYRINMHVLYTVLHIFLILLVGRI